jgi:hypothetical protein
MQNSGKKLSLFFRHWSLGRNRLETRRILRVQAAKALGHPRSPRAEGQKIGKNPDVLIRPQSRARRALPGGRAHSGDLRILAAGGKYIRVQLAQPEFPAERVGAGLRA